MTSRKFTLPIVLGLALCSPAQAQSASPNYPNKPIRMIVPFPPGGATDIVGRIIASGLSKELGETVVVENKTGGGGNIGTLGLSRSPADGYTIGIATLGTHASNPACYPAGGYNPVEDFAPISNLARTPNVLTTYPELPAKDFTSLMAYIKQNPGKIAFASGGICGVHHMTGEYFKALTNTGIMHVPYRGSGPALIDVMAGRVQMLFDSLPGSLPGIRDGKLRAIAVASTERLALLPDVPTYAEIGLKELNDPAWYGLVAPAGTPPTIIAKLNEAIKKTLESPDTQAQISHIGAHVAYTSPEEFGEEIKKAAEKMKMVVKKQNIKPE